MVIPHPLNVGAQFAVSKTVTRDRCDCCGGHQKSSRVKAAAFGAFARVMLTVYGDAASSGSAAGWPAMLAWIAVATMTVGNLVALNEVLSLMAEGKVKLAGQDITGAKAAGFVVRTYIDDLRYGVDRSYWYIWTQKAGGNTGVVESCCNSSFNRNILLCFNYS